MHGIAARPHKPHLHFVVTATGLVSFRQTHYPTRLDWDLAGAPGPREGQMSARLKAGAAIVAAAVVAGGLLFAQSARTQDLKSYDSTKKDFWLNPPED
jgi:hypothetical protein